MTFVEEYIDDALSDRSWVDSPYAKDFVDNVATAFVPIHYIVCGHVRGGVYSGPVRFGFGTVIRSFGLVS